MSFLKRCSKSPYIITVNFFVLSTLVSKVITRDINLKAYLVRTQEILL